MGVTAHTHLSSEEYFIVAANATPLPKEGLGGESLDWQGGDAIIDVAAQLHRLQLQNAASESKESADASQIELTNVPDSLFQRLAEKSVRWDSLSGYLQRALLWDTGLVMTSGGRLVQVYAPCDEAMSVVLTTYEAFQDKGCPLETCDSTGLYFAGPTCSWMTVWKASQCGIHASEKNATDLEDAEDSTLWSEDGDLSSVLDVRLYKHTRDGSSGSGSTEEEVGSGSSGNYSAKTDVIFTINQIAPLPPTTEKCPVDPFFVAPCVQFHDVNEDPDNPWCLPKRGGFVDLWLENEISGGSMSSGGSSSISTTPLSSATTTSISGDTVILVVLFIFLAATIGALVAVHVYRKKRDRKNDEESSPTVYASATTTRSKRRANGHDMLNGSPRNSLNDSRRRRSLELTTFCADANITSKRIAYDSLTFDKLIARGASGEVWRGTCGSQIVAIKQLLPEKRHDENNVMLFSNEVRLASSLEHPNIVRFVGLSWNRVCDLCIVSEFMEQGDLSVLLNSKRKDELTWGKEKLAIATDIAEALAYLHGRQPIIIHRDLKSLNVLLDSRLRAKLSDFGLSRERSSDDTMTNGVGTLLWTAPEILRGEAYSEKADVYSYAIVLSELDTCLPPFTLNTEVSERHLTTMQLMHLATSGEVSPKLRDDCPESLQQLTAACASFEPSQRPNALEIVFTLRNIARSMSKVSFTYATCPKVTNRASQFETLNAADARVGTDLTKSFKWQLAIVAIRATHAQMVPVRRRGAFFLLTRYRRRHLPMRATLCLVCLLLLSGDCRGAGDLVARLYDLQTSGNTVTKLSLSSSALPSAVTSRLSSYSLTWSELSGLMQRALLWDSGFVFASPVGSSSSSTEGDDVKLVQIFTPCSQGMGDLLPDLAEIKTLQENSSCNVENCGIIGHFLPKECPVQDMIPLTRCAVYASDMDGQKQFTGVYWSEDGRSTSVPEPVLRRHTSEDTEASQSLFAVHLSEASFSGMESCQPHTDFILPCRGVANEVEITSSSGSVSFTANSSSFTEVDLCTPAHGTAMNAWLDLESTPSPETFSTTAIVLLAVAMLICVGLATSVWWLSRSRAWLQDAYDRVVLEGSWDDGSWSPTSHLLGGPLAPSLAVAGATDEERLTPMEVFFGARPRSRRSPGIHGTSALVATTRAEITLSNDQLCRKSTILRGFVSDPAIVTKRISFAQLHFLRLLAKGGSGEVWLGQYETRYVAMKCLLPTKREDPEALEQFAEEIRMASLLAHPRIVAFCGVAWQSLLHLCAVTEYMPRGDLESLLANPIAQKELSWNREKLTLSSDIVEALVYLHSLVPIVIHRDLKSKNVLLDRRLRAKLSDFGLSRERSVEDTMTNGIGTILWSAPEVLEGKRYDEKSDLFSFGVVLSEIDTCALPYGFSRHAKMRSMQIVHLVSEGKLLPNFRDDCPSAIRDLAQRCLSLDPAARPTAMEVAFELRSSIAPQLLKRSMQTVAGDDTGSIISSASATSAPSVSNMEADDSGSTPPTVLDVDVNSKHTQTEP
ncbi:Protein kinase [Phytophthora palmivora]|uniref:Protein kinase n=1 Tax=Phytophthora palmivora TaxID=4796 RepID=A0A2P4X0G6_9STRA|nr:Protein kinase [Phytophthora palmivora]